MTEEKECNKCNSTNLKNLEKKINDKNMCGTIIKDFHPYLNYRGTFSVYGTKK